MTTTNEAPLTAQGNKTPADITGTYVHPITRQAQQLKSEVAGVEANNSIESGFINAARFITAATNTSPYPMVNGKVQPTLVLLAKHRPSIVEMTDYVATMQNVFKNMRARVHTDENGMNLYTDAVRKADVAARPQGMFAWAKTVNADYFSAMDQCRP